MPVFLAVLALAFWLAMNAFSEAVIGFLVALAVGLGVGFLTFVPEIIDVPDTLVLDLGPPEVDTFTFPILILPVVAVAEGFCLAVTALLSTFLMRFGSCFIVGSAL
jgi:hypothetical protein